MTNIEETMPKLMVADELQDELHDHAAERRYEQRAALRLCLDEIATQVTAALRESNLVMSIYLAVPSTGNALLNFMTPLHPSESDWDLASGIICRIVSLRIEVNGLIGRTLTCAESGHAS